MGKCVPIWVVAGTHSGVGKTSVTLSMVAALRRRGLRVQPFKTGPDFLDPGHLARAAGRPCYNLDGWMTGCDYVRQLVMAKSRDADVAIIEGAMGLYDGAGPDTASGSAAEVAGWLDAPVVLVVSAHGAARSLAATVRGFVDFPDAPRFAGVVANHCGRASHADLVGRALNAAQAPALLGAIPRETLPALARRHLGLTTATPATLSDDMLRQLADAGEKYIRLDALLNGSLHELRARAVPEGMAPCFRLGLAQDDAFHFYYPDNVELLRWAGAEIVPFSPLRDPTLPERLDALWLGGGYPEEHAEALAANVSMRAAVRVFADGGGTVYAECGGLMYLARELTGRDGRVWPMTGVLPVSTRMCDRPQRLGYAEVELDVATFLGPPGTCLRGHEFHYSQITGAMPSNGWRSAGCVRYRDGSSAPSGWWNGRVLAGYVHAHFGSNADVARHWIQRHIKGGIKYGAG